LGSDVEKYKRLSGITSFIPYRRLRIGLKVVSSYPETIVLVFGAFYIQIYYYYLPTGIQRSLN
jgi:hypothetical protein